MNVLNKIKSKQAKVTNNSQQTSQSTSKEVKLNNNQSHTTEQANRPKQQTKANAAMTKSTKKLLSKVITEQNNKSEDQKQAKKEQKQIGKQTKGSRDKRSIDNKSKNSGDLLEISQTLDSRVSDFSDGLSNRSSISRLLRIQKQYKWMHPQLKHSQVSQDKQPNRVNQSMHKQQNKKEEGATNNVDCGRNDAKKQMQNMPREYQYLLKVKKGYQIGRMSIFQGFLEQNKLNNELKIRVRTVDSEVVKLSCKTQLISNPQSISCICMRRIVQVGRNQYLVNGADLVKAIEKAGNNNNK